MKRAIIVAAVMAMTALAGVSSAAAAGFVADGYPATVKAAGTSNYHFTLGIQELNCSNAGTGSTDLAGPAKSATLQPNDMSCTNGSLEFKGCKLTFRPAIGGAGAVEIGPAGCGPISLKYKTACEVAISPQSIPANYAVSGEGASATVSVDIETESLEYTQVKCTSGGPLVLSAGWKLSATKNAKSIGLQTAASALFMAGEESAEAAKQPRFEAEWTSNWIGNPGAAFGSQKASSPHVLKFSLREFRCGAVDFSGQFANPDDELPLAATYTGCTASGGYIADVKMNSCQYVLDALNVGPPYSAGLGVTCSKEGDAIEAAMFENATKQSEGKSLCLYKVGPQTVGGSVGLANTGTGLARGIDASLNLSGIAYTATGNQLVCGKSPGSATYTGGSTLVGL
ncbi:MAG TPA: hypothetical protein VFY48_01860 [Solirubrobacterales bacterium]|nr:hypothetical protein [Solirubrobacterales bacterium]